MIPLFVGLALVLGLQGSSDSRNRMPDQEPDPSNRIRLTLDASEADEVLAILA
jgi:hypothetical protein